MVLRFIYLSFFLICISCSNENIQEVQEDEAKQLSKDDAKALFLMRCASCHGEDGKLGMSGAKDLSSSKLNEKEIGVILKNGKNGMPSFGESLNLNQQEALVVHVLSLRK